MNNVKISVVTVCYNAVKELERTMLSVLNQTYDNVEYIVIDGGSTDGTVEIIKKYADRLAYWVSEPDKGIYDAMNKGVKVATGEWINFMNAGDRFVDEEVLTKLFEGMNNSEYGVIFGNSREYRENILYSVKPTPFYSKCNGHYNKGICHQSMFVKTSLHKRNTFNLQYHIAADFNMVYHLYHHEKCKFKYKDIDVAYYDVNGQSNMNAGLAYYEEECIINPDKEHNKRLLILKGKFKALAMTIFIFAMRTIVPPLLHKLRQRNKQVIYTHPPR